MLNTGAGVVGDRPRRDPRIPVAVRCTGPVVEVEGLVPHQAGLLPPEVRVETLGRMCLVGACLVGHPQRERARRGRGQQVLSLGKVAAVVGPLTPLVPQGAEVGLVVGRVEVGAEEAVV